VSPRLPRVTAAQAIRVLEKLGFGLARQSGSHKIYKNAEGKTISETKRGHRVHEMLTRCPLFLLPVSTLVVFLPPPVLQPRLVESAQCLLVFLGSDLATQAGVAYSFMSREILIHQADVDAR